MLGLVCNKNATCKFCSCYLQNDLMSVFRVCFGRHLFMSRSRRSNCFIVPPLPFSRAPSWGVQRYLWNSGAVNLSRELLRLRADFCLVCLSALFFYQSREPQFTAQVHKQLFWLNDRMELGWTPVHCKHQHKQLLYCAAQGASNIRLKGHVNEEMYFSVLCSIEHWVPILLVYSHKPILICV